MKKILIFAAAMLLVVLGGCGKKKDEPIEVPTQTYSGTAADFFSDVSAVKDFRCICTFHGGEQKIINSDEAKSIYGLLKKKMTSAEETDFGEKENESINLVFQKGTAASEDTEDFSDELNNIQYYGAVKIYDDDTLSFSGSPDASVELCYKVPEGTYSELDEKMQGTEE